VSVAHGATCPLRCGQCCEFWRDVPELFSDAVERPNVLECPHLGRDGCGLRQVDRPVACRDFICGVAQAVIDGKINHNEGVRLKENCYLDVPYRFGRRRGS
jgi:hypothetical protein